ncbi:MAG: AbrB/MazE/SpoVT family DNA-binding domain-containing protein [Thermofilum sp.]
MVERYRVKVHRKGIIVIPAAVRRRLGIAEGSYIDLVVDESGVRLLTPLDLRRAFGIDGEKALEVVKLISEARREELEKEFRA